MKKKKRAPSQLVICTYCKKQVYQRGLVNHIRLQHKLIFTQVKLESVDLSKKNDKQLAVNDIQECHHILTQVNDGPNKLKNNENSISKNDASNNNLEILKPQISRIQTCKNTSRQSINYPVMEYISECDLCKKNKVGVRPFDGYLNTKQLYLCRECFNKPISSLPC